MHDTWQCYALNTISHEFESKTVYLFIFLQPLNTSFVVHCKIVWHIFYSIYLNESRWGDFLFCSYYYLPLLLLLLYRAVLPISQFEAHVEFHVEHLVIHRDTHPIHGMCIFPQRKHYQSILISIFVDALAETQHRLMHTLRHTPPSPPTYTITRTPSTHKIYVAVQFSSGYKALNVCRACVLFNLPPEIYIKLCDNIGWVFE